MIGVITDHVKSILKGKWTKARLKRAYVVFQHRQNRGSSYLGEVLAIMTHGSIFMAPLMAINTWFDSRLGFTIPLWFTFVLTVFIYLGMYLIGFYDETRLGIWQLGSELNTKRVNPYYQRLEKDMTVIKKKLDKLCKQKTKTRT